MTLNFHPKGESTSKQSLVIYQCKQKNSQLGIHDLAYNSALRVSNLVIYTNIIHVHILIIYTYTCIYSNNLSIMNITLVGIAGDVRQFYSLYNAFCYKVKFRT
jgi:hypothetical protein